MLSWFLCTVLVLSIPILSTCRKLEQQPHQLDSESNIHHNLAWNTTEYPPLGDFVTTQFYDTLPQNHPSTQHTPFNCSPALHEFTLCTTVKDQNSDVREWVQYHHWLGASKIYMYDHNSSQPLLYQLQDWIESGVVVYTRLAGHHTITNPQRYDTTIQAYVYSDCLARARGKAKWMAFFDLDEFLILYDGSSTVSRPNQQPPHASKQGPHSQGALQPAAAFEEPTNTRDGAAASKNGSKTGTVSASTSRSTVGSTVSDQCSEDQQQRSLGRGSNASAASTNHTSHLQTAAKISKPLYQLLREYEAYGALAVHWRTFGSSGHVQRPPTSTLESFTSCSPNPSAHMKSIVNVAHTISIGGSPHVFWYERGRHAVNEALTRCVGSVCKPPSAKRIALHHYATKSMEEFQGKMKRGTGDGDAKTMTFFKAVDRQSTDVCLQGLKLTQLCCRGGGSSLASK